jgi:type IV fimbrial biogenesis protein FimT
MPKLHGCAARGISMIEVLVTVTILGLLLVAVMPSIGNWMRNTEIRNAAESIQNGLTKARAEAVKRNEVVYFSLVSHNSVRQLANSCTLASDTASWVVSKDNPAGKCGGAVDEGTSPFILAKQAQGEGSPNVTVSLKAPNGSEPCGNSGTGNPNRIGFNGFGRVQAEPPSGSGWGSGPLQCIEVDSSAGSGTRKLSIVISNGGTVRMCDPAVSDSTDPRKC